MSTLDPPQSQRRVCVYCASSSECAAEYHLAAFRLGEVLADEGYTIVYGGGAVGSMGALADGVISKGGRIIGILPRFMQELEMAHTGLSELLLVEDMRTRKHLMLTESSGVIALPGGSGTLEELLEAITLKRLGLYRSPIVLVNTRGYFNPLIELLASAASEKFMSDRHLEMWRVVSDPHEAPAALASAGEWPDDARRFATR